MVENGRSPFVDQTCTISQFLNDRPRASSRDLLASFHSPHTCHHTYAARAHIASAMDLGRAPSQSVGGLDLTIRIKPLLLLSVWNHQAPSRSYYLLHGTSDLPAKKHSPALTGGGLAGALLGPEELLLTVEGRGLHRRDASCSKKKRHKVPHSYLLGVSGVEHYVKLASVSKVKLCWRFAYTRAA